MADEFPKYCKIQHLWHKSLMRLSTDYQRKHGPGLKFVRPTASAQESADMVYNLLSGDAPCMIARYGSTELNCMTNYIGTEQGIWNLPGFIRGTREPWWWVPARVNDLRDFSGFFPLEKAALEAFCEFLICDSEEVDILASWRAGEHHLRKQLKNAKRIFLPYLEPYYAEKPWTRCLAGKKVLVIHPFAPLIEKQYNERRSLLFKNPDILPEFELQTIQAVQTLGGRGDTMFLSWFTALASMEQEIDKRDFDIALIGCGAYGFPMAAHVKFRKKKAVHLGGALQLLFGIKGKRWEDPMYGVREWGLPKGFYTDMFASAPDPDAWIKAGDEFKSPNADKVEGGCYW